MMGERFEIEEMYSAYIALAKHYGDKAAEISLLYALEAEMMHYELFEKAKEHVDRGEDMPVEGHIWICPVCGYTVIGEEPPAKCPICGVLGKDLVEF